MAAGKKSGRKSQASNDFLEPQAPINLVGTDVGTSRAFNNGAVSVAFELPALSPAATSYTVTSSPGSFTATGSSSPLTVTGLQSNTAYTFTVTATNAAGTSQASTASASVTATTVPATPAAPTVTTSALKDTVSWIAPATGGKAISGYTWASSDSKGATVGSGTTSVEVTQEANTSQTYTVYATNANGNSVTSDASNSVTTPPFFPPFFPFFPPFFPPYFPFFPFFPFFPPFFPSFGGPSFPRFVYSSKRFKYDILKVVNIKLK
jgi:hypothetical protein